MFESKALYLVEGNVIRALVCRQYGPPESLSVDDIATPEAGPGQVRVKVEAAAVNFPDVLICANQYQVSIPVPFTPGSEFAGRVDQVGEGVESFAVGDRVFGSAMVGAFAEYVAVPASTRFVEHPTVSRADMPLASGLPTPRRITRCGLWPRSSRERSSWCSGRQGESDWPPWKSPLPSEQPLSPRRRPRTNWRSADSAGLITA